MVVDIEKIFAIISCEDPSFVESLKEIAHHGLKVRFKRVVRTATLPCVKQNIKSGYFRGINTGGTAGKILTRPENCNDSRGVFCF